MALARNLATNVANQVWTFLLNIVALPAYLALLGPESYALVGFGLTIQIWATLLDAGMSPTLSRDMARFRSGELSEADLLSFLRSLDWICAGFIISACLAGFATRDWWARSWFQDHGLSDAVIGDSVALIIAFSMIRWSGGLYRSAVLGLDRQVFANVVSAAANTLRLIGSLPLIWLFPDPRLLFAWWLGLALIELAVFRLASSRAFSGRLPIFHFSGAALLRRAKLAASIAFLSLVWLLVTQTDKLILSRVLPLATYGYFTLAVVLSNGFLMLSMPIMQAFQPPLTMAAAKSDQARLRQLAHLATQVMALALITPALIIAAFPLRILFSWTGDAHASAAVAPYLGYYVLGSAFGGPAGLAYAIQLAHGNVKLHVIANLLFALVLIPAVWFIATEHGALGASLLWLGLNLALIVFYCPLVLHRLLPGQIPRWFADLLPPALAAAGVVAVSRLVFGDGFADRYSGLALPVFTGLLALIAAAATTSVGRDMIRRYLPATGR